MVCVCVPLNLGKVCDVVFVVDNLFFICVSGEQSKWIFKAYGLYKLSLFSVPFQIYSKLYGTLNYFIIQNCVRI